MIAARFVTTNGEGFGHAMPLRVSKVSTTETPAGCDVWTADGGTSKRTDFAPRIRATNYEVSLTVADALAGKATKNDLKSRLFAQGIAADDEQQTCVIWQLIERHRDAAGHVLGEKCMEGLDLPEEFSYRSIHFAQRGGFKKRILRVAGFKRDPILAPRYSVSGGNLYGVGIGKRMLPSVTGLQTATRMLYEAVGQVVRPPVNAPAEMKQGRM